MLSQKPNSHCRPSPPLAPFQTILVGDSGVGKTSLLVQFDQGKFIPGSFSATVGIGFTVSAPRLWGPGVSLSGSQRETGGRSHWIIQAGLIRRLLTKGEAGCWGAGVQCPCRAQGLHSCPSLKNKKMREGNYCQSPGTKGCMGRAGWQEL